MRNAGYPFNIILVQVRLCHYITSHGVQFLDKESARVGKPLFSSIATLLPNSTNWFAYIPSGWSNGLIASGNLKGQLLIMVNSRPFALEDMFWYITTRRTVMVTSQRSFPMQPTVMFLPAGIKHVCQHGQLLKHDNEFSSSINGQGVQAEKLMVDTFTLSFDRPPF